jgi:triacylglycerol lipase
MDRQTVGRLAQITAQSYKPRILDENLVCSPVRRESTEAFVCVNDDAVVVVFTGTDEMEDVKLDFMFRRTKMDPAPGAYHRGFVKALDEVFWQIYSKVQFNYDKPLYVTGHSLGGALAVLFAARLRAMQSKHNLQGVVTFGAPRVANLVAARWIDQELRDKIIQFENAGDGITHVPMFVLGYSHVGRRVVFGSVKPNSMKTRFRRFMHKVLRTRIAHSLDRYVMEVEIWARNGA